MLVVVLMMLKHGTFGGVNFLNLKDYYTITERNVTDEG